MPAARHHARHDMVSVDAMATCQVTCAARLHGLSAHDTHMACMQRLQGILYTMQFCHACPKSHKMSCMYATNADARCGKVIGAGLAAHGRASCSCPCCCSTWPIDSTVYCQSTAQHLQSCCARAASKMPWVCRRYHDTQILVPSAPPTLGAVHCMRCRCCLPCAMSWNYLTLLLPPAGCICGDHPPCCYLLHNAPVLAH